MFRSLLTVSGFTLLSRVLGLLREMLIANYLGAGAKSDVWVAAFRFPNMFRRILGEGAFNSAFVPLYSGKLATEGAESAANFGSRVTILLSIILGAICVVSYIFMEGITRVLTDFKLEEDTLAATHFSKITVVYLFFICAVSAVSGILNSHKKFAAASFSYALLNVVFLVGILCVMPFVEDKTAVLSWSLVAAGVLQLGIVVVALVRSEFQFKFVIPKIDSDMIRLYLLMGPGLISAGVQQFNLIVGQWVASKQTGGMSIIFYSDRVNQLPLGIIGMTFAIVLLPELAKKLKGGQRNDARLSIEYGMTMSMFVSIPAMMGMAVLAEPIMVALFKGGEFTLEQGKLCGQALLAFSIGCPAYIAAKVMQAGYFASDDTKTPMKFTMISAGVNMLLCLVAWAILGSGGALHVGCAAATSVAGWVNILLLMWGLKRQGLLEITRVFWKEFGKMLIASLVMGIAVWVASDLLRDHIYEGFRLIRVSILGLVASFGVFLYLLVAHLMGVRSLKNLKGKFRRKII
jgi:putative peptidoglycan lipid II flippase